MIGKAALNENIFYCVLNELKSDLLQSLHYLRIGINSHAVMTMRHYQQSQQLLRDLLNDPTEAAPLFKSSFLIAECRRRLPNSSFCSVAYNVSKSLLQ